MPAPVLVPGFTHPPTPFRSVDVMPARGGGSVLGAPAVATAIRYVRKTGSDSNGGTSPSDAWLTVGKALSTAPAGAVVYVGAGVYRETVTITITPTAALPVTLVGDVDGSRTGDAGMVQLSAYTSDKAAPANAATLALNGKSWLSFQNIMFVGGNFNPVALVHADTTPSTNINFVDCGFMVGASSSFGFAIRMLAAYGVPANWLFDRCYFLKSGVATILVDAPTGSGGDYDLNVLARNCMFVGPSGNSIQLAPTGALAGKPGGVRAQDCTHISGGPFFATSANSSTSVPCMVTGCHLYCGANATALSANVAGQIVEQNNLILAGTPRTNVAVGAGSISDGSYPPLFHFGQERIWGAMLRAFGEPMAGSPLLAFGVPDTSPGLLDLRAGPRPSVASRWDVGALQRGNNYGKETGTVHTGTNAISILGAGFQDFDLPVDAGQVSLSLYVRYDGSYTGPLPSWQVLENGELGVGKTEVESTPAGLNAWEQLTVTVNPTGNGIVTVRIVSNDASGAGHVYADSFSVA